MSNSTFILKLLILNLNPPQKTSPSPHGFLNEFFLISWGIMAHILERLFQRLDKMKHFPTSSETTLTLMPKPDKDIIRNKTYGPTVPMNIATEILNKILAQIIQ